MIPNRAPRRNIGIGTDDIHEIQEDQEKRKTDQMQEDDPKK